MILSKVKKLKKPNEIYGLLIKIEFTTKIS
jgi:hypothetical protein